MDELSRRDVLPWRRAAISAKAPATKVVSAVYELMPFTDKVRELILAHGPRPTRSVRRRSKAGMRSLKDDAMEKILLGITTLEESLRVIYAG